MSRVNPLVLITILLSVVVVGQWYSSQVELKTAKHEYVYQICNSARQEISGTSEENCGAAQDRTHTEFLCTANNSLASTHCWVEDK